MFRFRRLASVVGIPALFSAAIIGAALTIPAFAAISSIRLSAERTVLRADGLSTTIITATVYDDRGNLVPDGTRVRFSTTAGRLDSTVVSTQGGTARATLTSADQPGEALVVAALDTPGATVPQNITIAFSRDVDTAETGIAWARIDGPYVAYAWDYDILQANGNKKGDARFRYRGLTVTAQEMQIDVTQNVLVAQGNVTLTRNGVTRTYRSLNYSLQQGEGTGERLVDNHLESVTVRGSGLTETPPPAGSPPTSRETYEFANISRAQLTVVAHSVALEPSQQIQFRGASFYLDGKKSFYFPFHIMGIGQKTIFPDQVVGLSSEGPTINYPIYLDVQPTGVGTLHLRHGAPIGASAYAVRPGWNLDVTQTYNGPRNVEGSVDVYGVGRSGWNAQVRHGQRLDPITTGSLFLDMSQLDSALLTTELTRNYPHFQLNATGTADRASGVVDPLTNTREQASGDARGQINLQSYSKPLFGVKQLLYSLNTNASRQKFYGGDTAVQLGTVITEAIGSRFFTTPLPVAPATTLTQSVNVAQTWVQGRVATLNGVPSSGLATQAQTSLNHQLGHLGSTFLSYDYTQTPQVLTSGITTQTIGTGHQRLGFGLNLAKSDQWDFNLTGSRGLDLDQTTAYATATYHAFGPWKGKKVAYGDFQVVVNDDTIQGTHYRDIEYRLTHHIASLERDFSIFYSTTAKRVQVDISAIGF